MFTLRRGDLLIAVNFSDVAVTLPEVGALLFTTPSAATVERRRDSPSRRTRAC